MLTESVVGWALRIFNRKTSSRKVAVLRKFNVLPCGCTRKALDQVLIGDPPSPAWYLKRREDGAIIHTACEQILIPAAPGGSSSQAASTAGLLTATS
jgi:hypothetical protein